MLTEAQKTKWDQDGYIRLEGFFDAVTRDKISNGAEEVARWDVSDDKWMLWFEKTSDNRKIISKAENFLDYHDVLRETLLADGRISETIETLLDENARMLKELLIFKYPDSGGYRPHQDIYHVHHNVPERMVHAIAAVAIDDSVPDNGGLFFTPGRHKEGLFPMDDGWVINSGVSDTFKWEPTPWKAGDLFIFDDYAPHYSLPNKSDRSRRALYLVFQRASSGGPTRAEYNRMKRAYNPPEDGVSDLENLKLPNGILYRD
ncbi:phytanoyl-CoA dioxygenase family protein [Bradyrhizobium sp. Tv2a-2]|uniref:phytanoyl-CoA dioxygenase family protein n=1 Tax=Bradyrhizobium sp. Tv2a-2 TaxID=113395 RepID=UPI00041FAF7D|nr:phytanoyl-CoA dioxygenase family protein [Bradyrhizobium sp. Tv2a-2]